MMCLKYENHSRQSWEYVNKLQYAKLFHLDLVLKNTKHERDIIETNKDEGRELIFENRNMSVQIQRELPWYFDDVFVEFEHMKFLEKFTQCDWALDDVSDTDKDKVLIYGPEYLNSDKFFSDDRLTVQKDFAVDLEDDTSISANEMQIRFNGDGELQKICTD